MTVLVTGSTGFVGSALVKELQNNSIRCISYAARYPLNEQHFANVCMKNNVEHVYNCSGYIGIPNVDACELESSKIPCLQGNAFLPTQMAKVCADYGIRFNHISSGCIYTDSACDRAAAPTIEFKESDAPNFNFDSGRCSWYSGTKALAEQLLGNAYCGIYRMRIPFDGSINARNYLHKLCSYSVLLNATNSVSNLHEFVAAVVHLSRNAPNLQVVNVTQPGYIKTTEVVEMLKQKGLIKDVEWFRDIESFNCMVKAPRSNCVLDTKLAQTYKAKLTPVHDSMMQAIDEYYYNFKAL